METIILDQLNLRDFEEFVPYELLFESVTRIDVPDEFPEMFVVMSQWFKLTDEDQSNRLLALFEVIEGDFYPYTELYYEDDTMILLKTELYNRT